MSKLRLRSRVKLFASLFSGIATSVRKDGLAMYVDMDWSSIGALGSYNPSAQKLIAQSTSDGSFGTVTITQVITASQTEQVKTTAGDVNVAVTDGLIRINKASGAATSVNLPASSSKVGAVKVVDTKGDAATNNITIVPNGAETFNAGQTSWVIDSNGGSFVFTPNSDGSGYSV